MKLGPVTKIDKRSKATSEEIDGDIMPENYDIIAIFSTYGELKQSGSRIPDA